MMSIKDLLKHSTQAVCGITEREVVVPKAKKAAVIRFIKQRGWVYVGAGEAGRESIKIWFAPMAL